MSVLLRRPGGMPSFYPGKHFLNFIHRKIHCVQLQKQEKMVSWLSEQHYLNKISRLSVLIWPGPKGRCGGDMLILFFSVCEPQLISPPRPGSVSTRVTLSKAQSQCLGLLICGTGPGIPFTPASQPDDVKRRLRVKHYIGVNYKVLKHGTKYLLNSIVYYKNIFSSRNSCESGTQLNQSQGMCAFSSFVLTLFAHLLRLASTEAEQICAGRSRCEQPGAGIFFL